MLSNFRKQIENYINSYPLFKSTLLPYSQDKKAPEIIKSMIHTTALCGVGPMASVAGAIAEFVGKELLNYSSEVIVENGGDIFIKSNKVRKVSIFAENYFEDRVKRELYRGLHIFWYSGSFFKFWEGGCGYRNF
jgi:hypothetical protein